MNKEKAKKIFNQIWSLRDTWEPVWKELAEYLLPTRGSFNSTDDRKQGGKKIDAKKIIDSTPVKAVKTLSAGMMGGLTSPSLRWFFLRIKGLDEDYGDPRWRWLHEVQEILENVLDGAGIYNALHNFYQEISVFGTAAFFIEQDAKTVIRAVPLTIGEYAIDVDERGKPCRVVRKINMTNWQLKSAFGEDNLPEKIKQELNEKRYDIEHTVYHLITPNTNRDVRKKDNRNMPYLSLYWMSGLNNDGFLRQSGYEEFPLVCARWDVKNDSEVYGKGPGWEVLGDVKMLQRMEKTALVVLDKTTNPPVMVSSSVQGVLNLNPGGVNRYSGTTDPGVKPVYQVNLDFNALMAKIQNVEQRVNSMFFVDLFLMLAGTDMGQMTATEVQARQQEKMMVLGPVLQRLKEELLDVMLERVFNICWRAGLLPEPPEEMQDNQLDVEYVSVIAQAQKNANVQTIAQGIGLAQNWAQTDPTVLDYVDFGAALQEAFKAMGAPAKMIRPKNEVAQIREQRALQQQAAMQMEQAHVLVNGAKTLSETQVGTGSALDMLGAAINEGAQ